MCFFIESIGSSGASSFCISSPPYVIFTLFSTLNLLEKMVYTGKAHKNCIIQV